MTLHYQTDFAHVCVKKTSQSLAFSTAMPIISPEITAKRRLKFIKLALWTDRYCEFSALNRCFSTLKTLEETTIIRQ